MPSANLTNEAGEVTSHLQGIFSRTIRLMEMGIRPVYVFDGKAPTMKSGEVRFLPGCASRQPRPLSLPAAGEAPGGQGKGPGGLGGCRTPTQGCAGRG